MLAQQEMLGFMRLFEPVPEDCTCVFRLYVETYLHKGVNFTHRVFMCAGIVSMCARRVLKFF